MRTWLAGGTVIVQSNPAHLDPVDIWSLAERERVTFLLIVGDAFARPLLDELERSSYDLSALTVILSGGAPLRRPAEGRAAAPPADGHDRRWPRLVGGRRAAQPGVGRDRVGRHARRAAPDGHVPRQRRQPCARRVARPRCSTPAPASWAGWPSAVGWPSATSAIADKTNRTYPVVDGVRYAVPGDRARLRSDGTVELHGRDSVTINSGGEKIFAEEVEAAIKAHPAVYDCVVAPAPERALGPGGRRHRAPARRRRCGHHRRPRSPKPPATSPATRCPSRSCSSTRSSAPPPARPTTAGPATSRPASPT